MASKVPINFDGRYEKRIPIPNISNYNVAFDKLREVNPLSLGMKLIINHLLLHKIPK